jgi:pimeloyl-ACP methyl ester carboxylesterase
VSHARKALVATLLVCGLALAVWGARRAVKLRPEQFVDVDAGGHTLRMCVAGDRGPVVILESGLPGGLGFEHVRGPVSRFARAVAYSRAGVGESQPGPLPRDANQIVRELHVALANAKLPPPYLLVGQSMGGVYMRVFAATYPNEVRGIVLVDPARADSYQSFEDVKVWFAANAPEQWPRVEETCRTMPEGADGLMATGAKRMEGILSTHSEPLRSALRREYRALVDSERERLSPPMSSGAREEFKSFGASCRQAVEMRARLPRVPIVLMVAGQQDEYSEVTASITPTMRTLAQDVKYWKIADSQRWVDATPGAKLVVASRSGHNIQTEAPGLVVDAIRDVLERGGSAGNKTSNEKAPGG